MEDLSGTNRELIEEISVLKQKIQELEHSESERKQADEALRESEERFRTLSDKTPLGMSLIDMDGRYEYVNPAFVKIFGYHLSDIPTGKEWFKAAYPDPEYRREVMAGWTEDLSSYPELEIRPRIYEVKCKGGAFRTILFRPVTLPSGRQLIIYEDITDRKRAAEVIQEEKYLSESIINSLPGIFYLFDAQGKFLRWNRNFEIVSGYSHREMLERHPADFFTGEDKERVQQRIRDTFIHGEANVEAGFVSRNGAGVPYFFTGVRIEINGQPHLMGMGVDITERKRIEDMCRNAEARYRVLFEQSPNGILLMDVEAGKTIEANETAYKQLGYTREEFAALRISDYEALEKPEETAKHIQKVICDGSDDFETLHRTKSGEIRNVHVWVKTVQLSDRSFIYAIFQDITMEKHAEEQLQKTLDSLRKAVNTTIQVMVSAVETRDAYTAGHQVRSANLARAIATEMGLPQEKIDGIRMAGSIHDIGKLSIPAEILSKPTKLSEIEFSLIKEHARQGFEILRNVESPWPLAEIVYQHHERMDSSGYPRHLSGEDILLEARILAVADVVEAMASHRPYRAGLGIDTALNEIEKNRGIFYDNAVADACLSLFRGKGFKLEGA